ncbi:MAG: alpha-ribazole phosphatase [Chloroflexota bacterium]
MGRLVLVRHGETEWNRTFRFQGQSDIELSEVGLREAERVSDRLSGEKIDTIYASDLKRAATTAQIIASRHGMSDSINYTPMLRELSFGDFEGLTFDEIQRDYHDVFNMQDWIDRPLEVVFPNGEGVVHLATRTKQFTESLDGHVSEGTTLLVAHGGALQVLICQLLGMDLSRWWRIRLSSCSVSIVDNYPYRPTLTLLNDVCHLNHG